MPSPKGPPELKHLERILVTPTAIRRRIAALGQQLNRDYAKKDLMVVAIVNGALIFTALPEILRVAASWQWQMLAYGVVLVLTVFFLPRGIVPALTAWVARR